MPRGQRLHRPPTAECQDLARRVARCRRPAMRRFCGMVALALCMIVLVSNHSSARDNGQFANSPLKQRFDQLASGKGLCCSFADGVSMSDIDWDSQDGHYVCAYTESGLTCPKRRRRQGAQPIWTSCRVAVQNRTAKPRSAALCQVPGPKPDRK
jgi:hypothetical protein